MEKAGQITPDEFLKRCSEIAAMPEHERPPAIHTASVDFKPHCTKASITKMVNKVLREVKEKRQADAQAKRQALIANMLKANAGLEKTLDELSDRYVAVNIQGHTRVFDRTTRNFMKPVDLALLYDCVPIADPNIETDDTLGRYWIKLPDRPTCQNGIGIYVHKPTPPGILNLWAGWGVEPIKSGWGTIYTHIKDVICGNDTTLLDYTLNWMAYAVQRADEPIGTALIITGTSGSGKTIMADLLMRIFGDAHSFQATDPKHLSGNFNAHLRDVLLLNGDEVDLTDTATLGKVRAMITAKTRAMELKGVDTTTVPNLLRIIITTEHEHAAHVSRTDRRMAVLKTKDHRVGDRAYFDKLVAAVEGSEAEGCLNHLLNRDISDFRPADIPESEARKEQKALSLEPVEQWWVDVLRDGLLVNSGPNYWVRNFDPERDRRQSEGMDTETGEIERSTIMINLPKWHIKPMQANGSALMQMLQQWWIGTRQQGPVPTSRQVFPMIRDSLPTGYESRESSGAVIFNLPRLDDARNGMATHLGISPEVLFPKG